MKRRVLTALAWISVGLSIPMASFAIYDGFADAAWEEFDTQWADEDRVRHRWIMGSLVRLENRCGA